MSLDPAIAQIWAGRLLQNLNRDHVFASLLTREYEGDIGNVGDSVRIQTVGRVAISDYTKNTSTLTYETLDVGTQVLPIDQAKSFAFRIDDIDKLQQRPKLMDAFIQEATFGFNDEVDTDVGAVLSAGVATANILTAAPSVGTGASDQDAYEILVDLGVKLDENNVPRGGRWVVIPPWFRGMLMKDPRFVSFGTPDNKSTLRNGMTGDVDGMTVHVSNNVPVSGSDYTIIAGTRPGAGFVQQIRDMESIRLETRHADGMRGLLVYGRKVVDPTRLTKIVATQAT